MTQQMVGVIPIYVQMARFMNAYKPKDGTRQNTILYNSAKVSSHYILSLVFSSDLMTDWLVDAGEMNLFNKIEFPLSKEVSANTVKAFLMYDLPC